MHKNKPEGCLAILMPGLGAVASTFIAGVEMARRDQCQPIGSLSQLGTARLGKRTDNRYVKISDLVPLASLQDLVFGAWDIIDENCAQVVQRSRVLTESHQNITKDFLQNVCPKPGVHDPKRVPKINANYFKKEKHARERIESIRQDIRDFKKNLGAKRAVMIYTASTEVFLDHPLRLTTCEELEKALDDNHPSISPTVLYAYSSIVENVPFANGTPNICVDMPALQQLARERGVPIAGKDLKSGQTMMKTVLAPALKARVLGLHGWFSTNILGNRDGEVLDEPQAFRSKEITKTGVLDSILQPQIYPSLYSNYSHKVSIHYYPPRGDDKEGWDNIDIFGWMGYPMQLKVNFLCKDSILAAPLVLDIALFLDLAARLEWKGIQEWLSFYFKCPMADQSIHAENDLFIQLSKLKNTLRVIGGEEPINHLGMDYYGDNLPLPR
jgi:myo-inositol-1-phosphate synthase